MKREQDWAGIFWAALEPSASGGHLQQAQGDFMIGRYVSSWLNMSPTQTIYMSGKKKCVRNRQIAV